MGCLEPENKSWDIMGSYKYMIPSHRSLVRTPEDGHDLNVFCPIVKLSPNWGIQNICFRVPNSFALQSEENSICSYPTGST